MSKIDLKKHQYKVHWFFKKAHIPISMCMVVKRHNDEEVEHNKLIEESKKGETNTSASPYSLKLLEL